MIAIKVSTQDNIYASASILHCWLQVFDLDEMRSRKVERKDWWMSADLTINIPYDPIVQKWIPATLDRLSEYSEREIRSDPDHQKYVRLRTY